MHSILRRTTALVAVAALPFAPAALAGSETVGEKTGEHQATEAIQPQDVLKESRSQEARDAGATDDNQMAQPAQRGRSVDDQNRTETSAQAEPAQTGAADAEAAQSELVPSDDEIKVYKSQKEEAPDRAQVTKEDGEYIDRSTQGQQAAGQQQADRPGDEAGQAAAETAEDMTVATVNDQPIRRSDVLAAIEAMPAQLQQQPAEMLVPLAIDQLVTRHLILQQAREAGLEQDEEVTAMAPENATETARENALVQVWLDRELQGAVSDQAVQEMYDAVAAELGDQAPPLEQVRPQIEQELRRQAFAGVSEGLHQDAEIVLYGPQGEPVTIE